MNRPVARCLVSHYHSYANAINSLASGKEPAQLMSVSSGQYIIPRCFEQFYSVVNGHSIQRGYLRIAL